MHCVLYGMGTPLSFGRPPPDGFLIEDVSLAVTLVSSPLLKSYFMLIYGVEVIHAILEWETGLQVKSGEAAGLWRELQLKETKRTVTHIRTVSWESYIAFCARVCNLRADQPGGEKSKA